MRRHLPGPADASTEEAPAPRQLDLDALLIPFQRRAPASESHTIHPPVAWSAAPTASNR